MSDTAVTEQITQTDNGLSRKKRMALVMYLAVLFIAALAVVTLSLVIQIHGNTEQYNTISAKAYELQEQNQQLMEHADDIQTAYDCLLRAKAAAAAEDESGFVSAMHELQPLQENLSAHGQEEYNELAAMLAEIETVTQTTEK